MLYQEKILGRKLLAYVPGTVSDTSAVVTFIVAVLHLRFQLQQVHLSV